MNEWAATFPSVAVGTRHLRALPVLAVVCLLAGCASRPEAVLQPLSTPAGDAAKVDLLVATTRQKSENPGLLFTGDRGAAVSFDNVVVSIPPEGNRKVGEVQWPKHLRPDPEKEFAVLTAEKVGSEQQLLKWASKNRNPRKQALIFVHGFNNTYADAVFRFAQIVHDAGTDATPILFTWPSRASVSDYLYDKESANYSRRALEDLIIQVSNNPDVDDVTILAHSMGAWLTTEALRGVAMRQKAIPAKVHNVVLASPDIDVDVFRRQITEMGPRRPQFTILASTRDKALQISRLLSGGVDRVGGADLRPYAGMLKEFGISVIDTSTINSNDPLGHNAFADSPDMIRLLGRRLAGQSLVGQETLGDRVGAAAIETADLAGSALRTAIIAPMSVVSQDARDALLHETSPRHPLIVDGQIPY